MSEPRTNSFSIIELLQYVRRTKETGRLTFEEGGKIVAELYFQAGHLVHAHNGKVEGDDVVYQLLSNKTARIRWEKNRNAPIESVSKTDEVLLLGALGILTEDDEQSVMGLVSREAEREMEAAFETPTVVPTTPPVNNTPVAAPPEPLRRITAEPRLKTTAPLTTPPLATTPATPEPQLPQVAPTVTPPVLSGNSNVIEGLGNLQGLLGDEVLRPPRFKKWSGLPLPFVSAYGLEKFADHRYLSSVLDLLFKERFSGFLSVVAGSGNIEAVTLLFKGRAVHTRFAEGRQLFKDQNAMRRLVDLVVPDNDRNAVLIYPLEPTFIHSYSALILGEVLLDSFSSTGMKINKLLNTLENSNHTGVVRVSNNMENGYIFLSGGFKLGSYYEIEDVLEESILRVYQIVGKPGSLIDVLSSPEEDKMFEVASRPKSATEIKQQMIELTHEILGKRANRIVNLLQQAEDNAPSLKTYANQARRVTQMFIDKGLADQLYERFMFLIQELN